MAGHDINTLQARLMRLQATERTSRMRATKIKKEMAAMDRRREAQYLCTLGRAWIALGERSVTGREGMHQFLRDYIRRDTDREILKNTPWDVTTPAPENDIESHPGWRPREWWKFLPDEAAMKAAG